MKSLVSVFVLFITLYLGLVRQVFAYEVPNFTSCVNPQGEIKANYESGTHGIVGRPGSFEGKDTVYTISKNSLTQCFCATDGNGIQTNWWKVSSLTESEIEALKSQGWNYVPNGALWGLESKPYLALNSEYICKNPGSSGGSGGSSSPGGSSGGSGGNILGVSSGSVLGLASTGNIKFLLTVLSFSILVLILGMFIKIQAEKYSN